MPVGIACILRRREPKQLILLGYAAVFLFALCLSGQHWERWIIQIVPVLSLSAACAAWACAGAFSGRAVGRWADRGTLFVALVTVVSVLLVCRVVQQDVRGMRPTTELLAREWAMRTLPAGSRVAQEWYTAPLDGAGFVVERRFTLAEDRTPDDYAKAGFRVIMASSRMYDRYYAEPRRYPREISFYEELSRRGTLLARFDPSWARGGPVVPIYALPSGDGQAPLPRGQ